MSVSEVAEPGGAETGFSLDISPQETGRRGAVAAVSHTCSTSCVCRRTETIHAGTFKIKKGGFLGGGEPLDSPYPPENVDGIIRLAEEEM